MDELYGMSIVIIFAKNYHIFMLLTLTTSYWLDTIVGFTSCLIRTGGMVLRPQI